MFVYNAVHLLHTGTVDTGTTGGFSFPRKGWTVDEWDFERVQPLTDFIHKTLRLLYN